MNDRNEKKKKRSVSISLVDVFYVVVKHRWLILVSTFVSALLIVLFLMTTVRLPPDHKLNLLPNYYQPFAEILIQQSDQSIMSRLSSSSGSPLSIMMGVQSNPELEMAKTLLEGNIIKDQIIREFDFPERYMLSDSVYPEISARRVFEKSLNIEQSEAGTASAGNLFKLKYRDTDPLFARQVLSRIVELLEERFRNISLERILQKKRFIEERLVQVESEMKQAQNNLIHFQTTYGVSDLSNNAEMQMSIIEDLQAEILRNELEIQTLKEYLPDDSPRIVMLRQDNKKKTELINELKTGTDSYSGEIIPLNELPSLTARYLELRNEMEIKQSIYKMLRNEYEAVKIQENDNSTTFQVIEPPELLVKKTGPKRSIVCIIMVIAVFVLSVFMAFFKEYLERIKRDPEESSKLERIRSMLGKRS